MRTLVSVVGARPNFVKVAPIVWEVAKRTDRWRHLVVHTGQHMDPAMSDSFFTDLGIPYPEVHCGVPGGPAVGNIARTMCALEDAFTQLRPDMVMVYGDVNSTLAGALVANKMGLPLAHVEAGLRSGDWTMPEEANRVLVDQLADVLLVPDHLAHSNLRGCHRGRAHVVGNLMIDTLREMRSELHSKSTLSYVVVTLHRPSNVDDPTRLEQLVRQLVRLSDQYKVVFPAHPRTRQRLEQLPGAMDLLELAGVDVLPPLRYPEMVGVLQDAQAVVTDSGGVQEETTYMGIPCVTVRSTTERPVTLHPVGTSFLEPDVTKLGLAVQEAVLHRRAEPPTIPLWDGKTAPRILDVLEGVC